MNCKQCSAWSTVLETRRSKDGFTVHRRHRCANNHVFWSVQKPAPSKLDELRAARAARNAAIVAAVRAGEHRQAVAARYNVHTATVHRLARRATLTSGA